MAAGSGSDRADGIGSGLSARFGPGSKPPATHIPPGTQPPVAPPAGGKGPDPTLASWANFSVEVLSSFRIGWIDAYDPETHQYDQQYINPNGYEVHLDATIGLRMNRGDAAIASAIDPTSDVPTTLDDFLDRIEHGDDLGIGGGTG